MSHLDCYNLSVNGEFKVRLAASFLAYAQGVVSEDASTPHHTERLVQAIKVINAPQPYADRLSFAAAVALNGAQPTDAQLDGLTAQYWDALALGPQVP